LDILQRGSIQGSLTKCGCGGCGTAFARARFLHLLFRQSYGRGYEVRMINPKVTLPTLHTFGHETLSIWGVDKGNGQV
jgi:hypothetical protein